jgi:hypothetical protein
MIRNANGSGPGAYQGRREVDMAIFDTLPPEVRRAMNEATFKYPSADFRAILARAPAERVAGYVPEMDRRILERERVRARAA